MKRRSFLQSIAATCSLIFAALSIAVRANRQPKGPRFKSCLVLVSHQHPGFRRGAGEVVGNHGFWEPLQKCLRLYRVSLGLTDLTTSGANGGELLRNCAQPWLLFGDRTS